MIIDINPGHLTIIKDILKNYNYSFYVFGSRVTGKAKRLSDVDIFYSDDIPFNLVDKIEENLAESDLPYKVDLVDFHNCDHDFQKIMLQNFIAIQERLCTIILFSTR